MSNINYLDITDLIGWFEHHSTPSGVQRVSLEAIRFSLNANNVFLAWFDYELVNWQTLNAEAYSKLSESLVAEDYSIFCSSFMKKGSISLNANGDSLYSLGMNWMMSDCRNFINFKNAHPSNRVGIYVHDLIPLTQPQLVDDGFGKHWSTFFLNACNVVDTIFCSTIITKKKIENFYTLIGTLPKLVVNPYGLDHMPLIENIKTSISMSDENRINEPYLITLGTIDTRKNQYSLVEPWLSLSEDLVAEGWKLLFLGRINDQRFKKMASVQSIKIYENLSDDEVFYFLSRARGALFPTLAEGFCFPAYEVASLGIPTVVTPLKEILEHGGSYFQYFKSLSQVDIRDQIHNLIKPEFQDTLNKNSIDKTKPDLSWDNFNRVLFNN